MNGVTARGIAVVVQEYDSDAAARPSARELSRRPRTVIPAHAHLDQRGRRLDRQVNQL